MSFTTYILKSQKDNGYYFGHTKNMDSRLEKHNLKLVRSTKARAPFELHYYEHFETKSEAFRREMFFKSIEGRSYLIEKNII
jgi:putative endonuclease